MSFLFLIITYICMACFCANALMVPDLYKKEIQNVQRHYCQMSDIEKRAYLKGLKNTLDVLPFKAKPYNYKTKKDLLRKINEDHQKKYNPVLHPHEEAAYKLGVVYSFISCQPFNPDQALNFFYKAPHKPQSLFMAGLLYYKLYLRDNSPFYLRRSLSLFKKTIAITPYISHSNIELIEKKLSDIKD